MARLSSSDLESILAVTRALAAPFDLQALLPEITAAARRVLKAERCSIWLLDAAAQELVVEVASDLSKIRVPVGRGLVGACAEQGVLINVPDCYADPRFNPVTDRATGFRSRCSLSLPLVDHGGTLIGVMQLVNKIGGVSFGPADETLAQALAAQCAVAISRVRMTQSLVEAERLRGELALARSVQLATLPPALPVVPGYAMHAVFLPAEQTGGDTYDLAQVEQGLLLVLGDATGHGLAPALSVLQMQAMLRVAMRLGSELETAFRHVNDRLCETLPDDRFITAFIGLLDAKAHRVRYLSGGQAPILHWRAAQQTCTVLGPTGLPLGAMPITRQRTPAELALEPGDWLLLLSDGVFETAAPSGALFGRERVIALLRELCRSTPETLATRLLDACRAFAEGEPQDDDITMLLLKREAVA